jgi:hypothetical protein
VGAAAVGVAEKASSLLEVRRKPVWVSVGPRSAEWGNELWLGVWETGHLRHLPLGDGDGDVHFGYSDSIGHPDAGLVAIREKPGSWRVLLRNGQVSLTPPPNTFVVGVGVLPHPVEEPALVLLGADKRTFMLAGKSETRTLMRASDDVRKVVVSHGMPAFAWMTVKGEVVVWSLKHSAVLYRAIPEAP